MIKESSWLAWEIFVSIDIIQIPDSAFAIFVFY